MTEWNEGLFHYLIFLPIGFNCENNSHVAVIRVSIITCNPNMTDRAMVFGMPVEIVDGRDVIKVNGATGGCSLCFFPG
jgi:TPP-dependent pyruvate/acetoin dehydrogenase alpha subunit